MHQETQQRTITIANCTAQVGINTKNICPLGHVFCLDDKGIDRNSSIFVNPETNTAICCSAACPHSQ